MKNFLTERFAFFALAAMNVANAADIRARATKFTRERLGIARHRGTTMKYNITGGLAVSALLIVVPFGTAGAAGHAAQGLPAPYDWTGWYAGVNVGGAWGTSDVVTQTAPGNFFNPANVPAINSNGNSKVDPNGFTGGIQAGYNRQYGALVTGIEADFDYFGTKASRSVSAPYITVPASSYTINQEVKTTWLFTARPRVGWAANNWLLYVTGGLAVTGLDYKNSLVDTFYPAAENGSVTQARLGWTAGFGVEYALLNSWSVRTEYLHAAFGSVSSNVPIVSAAAAAPINNSANLNENIVRLGINKKF
jgi:outer membrane immunogenic protein